MLTTEPSRVRANAALNYTEIEHHLAESPSLRLLRSDNAALVLAVLFSAFKRRLGTVLAIILPTLLFTAVHVPQYSANNTPDYATVITLLLLSLTLTLLRAGTGNLLPCIVLHTIFNGIQSAALIAEPYVLRSDPVITPGLII